MPIARLPPKTVHAISSSQVLTDSCSVVKELIDNSLDAEADAVFVELSLNALDIIQVRDNGRGIIPDDRPMVGKRHCTSKIRDLADLESIGGKSLGFRGEALASAAELSSTMIVSTRTEGEATAVSLTIGRKGEITKQERTSLPVGTTVRINGFLNAIPVRRQTALKTTTKSLVKVKKLLQAYALARPSVRFTLKILKAKNDNGNWMYAPKTGQSMLEAARQILGKDVVEQCQWKVNEQLQADHENFVVDGDSHSAEGCYQIEALLPKPKHDPQVISNIGQFISVDSRPVTCTRGTLKQIISLYKSYLGNGTLTASPAKPKDPILCMHISCPRASYDVNVEPAKDDVLFTNVDFVLGMLDKFFKEIYGEIQTKPLKAAASVALRHKARGYEVLLARKREPPASAPNKAPSGLNSASDDGVHVNSTSPVSVLEQTLADSKTKLGGNVSLSGIKAVNSRSNCLHAENRLRGGLTADFETAEEYSPANKRQIRQPIDYFDVADLFSSPTCADRRTDRAQGWEEEEGLRDPAVSNPWTFAKINTPIRQHHACRKVNDQLLTPGYQTGEVDEIVRRPVHEVRKSRKPNRHGLPTPQRTDVRHNFSAPFRSSSPEPYPFASNDSGRTSKSIDLSTHLLTEDSNHGFGTLDSWIQKPPDDDTPISRSSGLDDLDQPDQRILPPDTRDFVSARTILMSGSRGRCPQIDENLLLRSQPATRPASAEPSIQINLPDEDLGGDLVGMVPRSGPMDYSPSARDHVDSASGAASVSVDNQHHERTAQSSLMSNAPSVHPELARALDYEVRKQAAVKKWRANQSLGLSNNDLSRTSGSSVSSPHQNRYRRALATLRQPVVDDAIETTPSPALDYNDPRACLIRTQERDQSGTVSYSARKRRKTSSLPLETVNEQSTVRDLTRNIDTTSINVYKRAEKSACSGEFCDTYITSGKISLGLSSQGLTIDMVRAWEERVRELLKMSYKTNENMNEAARLDARINIWPLMQAHLAIHP